MQSCALLDPICAAEVLPGQGTQMRLSLLGWKERRSHSVHGANPVEENEPAEQGTWIKMIDNFRLWPTKVD